MDGVVTWRVLSVKENHYLYGKRDMGCIDNDKIKFNNKVEFVPVGEMYNLKTGAGHRW